jgi:hypothetical protein
VIVRRFVLCLVLLSVATLGVSVSPAGAADAYLVADLSGANERPGPGDPNAFGRAIITIDDDTNRLCLIMWWRNVDPTLSGLHIHIAPPTVPGPIVVPFQTPPPTAQHHYECRIVENEALLDNIAANPQQYYLNIHSTPLYGPGAARGQLSFL